MNGYERRSIERRKHFLCKCESCGRDIHDYDERCAITLRAEDGFDYNFNLCRHCYTIIRPEVRQVG